MRIINALPFGTTGRVHPGSRDLAAHGSDRRRGPRPIKAWGVVICMREFSGLAQSWPCGLFRCARSQAHAHVHFACVPRVAIVHVHVASSWPRVSSTVCSCPPRLPAAPAPRHVGLGRGRAPGAAPIARQHTPQLLNRGRRHLRVALETFTLIGQSLDWVVRTPPSRHRAFQTVVLENYVVIAEAAVHVECYSTLIGARYERSRACAKCNATTGITSTSVQSE